MKPWGLVGVVPNDMTYQLLSKFCPEADTFWRSCLNLPLVHTRADITAHRELWLRRVVITVSDVRWVVGVFFHHAPLALDTPVVGFKIFADHGATGVTEITDPKNIARTMARKSGD